ncbi:MAG TPA: type II 3-dehydroquinate dehydratase [Xanthobacteraceae bacterium]|nr:type II 3-dehydroquinate dehydratase [Xanthobacteraceae bacterium]
MAKTIYVLNGPNLNLLGNREPEKYGRATLKDIEALCRKTAEQHGLTVEFRQSNREGELIDWIHEARAQKAAGLIINGGGYSHTSIAIHDALIAANMPVIEVHITNVFAREEFRHHSFIGMAAKASLCGFGIEGYGLAITGLATMAGANKES